MKNKGLYLAAAFSYGCSQANILGVSALLKKYVESESKCCSEEKIKESLSCLISFFFYKIIAFANGIDDPFDQEVVKAYWIGNHLLEEVKLAHIKHMFEEFKKKGWDPVMLSFVLKPVIENRVVHLHHNVYASNSFCRITLKKGYFWHLGEPRIKATPRDVENFERYGRGKK